MILVNCIILMFLGRRLSAHKWLPQKLQKLYQATSSFERYMVGSYEKEKRWIVEGGLTDKGINGNLFVFNFIGHGTTSHTFAFAIALLVAHSNAQEWLSEEIRRELPHADTESWSHSKTFAQLTRCIAVLV